MSMSWEPGGKPALIEPVPIADTVWTGIARIEKLPGGWLRVVLFVEQLSADGEPERVLVSRLVGPRDGVQAALRHMADAMDDIESVTPGSAH